MNRNTLLALAGVALICLGLHQLFVELKIAAINRETAQIMSGQLIPSRPVIRELTEEDLLIVSCTGSMWQCVGMTPDGLAIHHIVEECSTEYKKYSHDPALTCRPLGKATAILERHMSYTDYDNDGYSLMDTEGCLVDCDDHDDDTYPGHGCP